jgi:hypothetical protein
MMMDDLRGGRNHGMMEYWNVGERGLFTQYSMIPTFQYPN